MAPAFYGPRPVNPLISSEILSAHGLCFHARQKERLEEGIRIGHFCFLKIPHTGCCLRNPVPLRELCVAFFGFHHSEESIPSQRAGDFQHVAAWLVYREIHRSKEFPFPWIVIRSTSEPIVVNQREDAWK